jgi:threonylcarbamoyladenosine tRNA methylthiotransferase MtaB
MLENTGLEQVTLTENPDLIVVNTCCVTHIASAKCRQFIRKANKLNPQTPIIVQGCLPAVDIGELNNLGNNVILVKDQKNIPATLSQLLNDNPIDHKNNNYLINDYPIVAKAGNQGKHKNKLSNQPQPANLTSPQPQFTPLTAFKGQTRAFLKVQNGCDWACSYCIIPKVRPDVHSKDHKQVLDEAQALVNAGHKEIVLTGIFLGAYGQSTVRRKKWPEPENVKLVNLLEDLAQVPGLSRIRLSSIEPGDVTESLLLVMAERANILPHLHLSLQSGSDAVLKRMVRQYSASQFLEKVDLIKQHIDRPALTTDIIVGFPGETDDEFQQTVELAKKVGFSKIHVFSFSSRKGTRAAKMPDKINPKIIRERSEILHQLNRRLASQFRRQFVGSEDKILVESVHDGRAWGRSVRYFMVCINNAENIRKNDLVTVRLVENAESSALAEVKL